MLHVDESHPRRPPVVLYDQYFEVRSITKVLYVLFLPLLAAANQPQRHPVEPSSVVDPTAGDSIQASAGDDWTYAPINARLHRW
jgi:hypothetical protein